MEKNFFKRENINPSQTTFFDSIEDFIVTIYANKMFYISYSVVKKANLKADDYIRIAFNDNIFYVEKILNPDFYSDGLLLKKGSKTNALYISCHDVFRYFKLDVKQIEGKYNISTFHDNGFSFNIESKINDPFRTKAAFVKMYNQYKLFLSASCVKKLKLKRHDIIKIFYDHKTKIVELQKNDHADLNGFLLRGGKKKNGLFVNTKQIIAIYPDWPKKTDRLSLAKHKDRNAFYFKLDNLD
jgi:hypothetical protein